MRLHLTTAASTMTSINLPCTDQLSATGIESHLLNCLRFAMETNRCFDRRQSTTTTLISRTTICRLFRVLSPETQWDWRKVNFASSPVTVTVNLDLSLNDSRQK
ncbi:hypothetical protein TNCV_2149511 [Trichonephila clavipes]|nr:hypothetical protein TNCV_2149511 [Trichonephila clavipes]